MDEGVEAVKIRDVLTGILGDLDRRLWEPATISLPLLYNLKDIVWYNIEHVPAGGNPRGTDTLRFLGTKYPVFMSIANDDAYVVPDRVERLLTELDDIARRWSGEWNYVQLITKSMDSWNPENGNSFRVIIYDSKTESPAQYGYDPYHKPMVLDHRGDYVVPDERRNIVLCPIDAKVGIYGRGPLIKSQLYRLIESCRNALNGRKGIRLDFDAYRTDVPTWR